MALKESDAGKCRMREESNARVECCRVRVRVTTLDVLRRVHEGVEGKP